jgi:uncharacterized membrane protein
MRNLIQSPARLFLILALVFGMVWIFLMPAGAGYDEETHLARIFEISRGHLIPNQWLGTNGNGIPQSMLQVSYRQQQFLQPVTRADIMEGLNLGITGKDWIAHQTRATYSPILYFPQAFLLAIFGYFLKTPVLILYWILRFTYLLTYVVTVYFAIRLMPKFKWTLFVLALAPMAMIQAISISADPLTNGMSFLFVAWSLYLVEGRKLFDKKTFWITLLLVFLLFSVKPNSAPLVLLLVLLKPAQFPSRNKLILLWLAIAALFVFEVGGWTAIQFQAEAARRELTNGQTAGFLNVFLADPLVFTGNLFAYVASNLPSVLKEYVASFGYGYYAIPTIVYILFWGTLAIAIIHDWQLKPFFSSTRIVLLVEFVFLFFGTFTLRFVIKESVEDLILSQGRYFIPFIPLLIFSLFGGQMRFRSRIPYLEKIVAIGAVVILSLVTIAMSLVYYVPCGMYIFTPGQCVLPVYKNWGPSLENALAVRLNSSLEQTFQPDCGKIQDLRVFTYNSPDLSPDAKFSLSIVNSKTGEQVVSRDYQISKINDDAMTILDFPAFNSDTNARYAIRITTSDPVGFFKIALSDRHRIRGTLTQEKTQIDQDLLFQYRCSD